MKQISWYYQWCQKMDFWQSHFIEFWYTVLFTSNNVVSCIFQGTSWSWRKGKGKGEEGWCIADAQNNHYSLRGDLGCGRGSHCHNQETEREMNLADPTFVTMAECFCFIFFPLLSQIYFWFLFLFLWIPIFSWAKCLLGNLICGSSETCTKIDAFFWQLYT